MNNYIIKSLLLLFTVCAQVENYVTLMRTVSVNKVSRWHLDNKECAYYEPKLQPPTTHNKVYIKTQTADAYWNDCVKTFSYDFMKAVD